MYEIYAIKISKIKQVNNIKFYLYIKNIIKLTVFNKPTAVSMFKCVL